MFLASTYKFFTLQLLSSRAVVMHRRARQLGSTLDLQNANGAERRGICEPSPTSMAELLLIAVLVDVIPYCLEGDLLKGTM